MNEQTIRNAIETGYTFGSYPDSNSLENQVRFAYNDAMKLRGQASQDPATEERSVKTIAKTLFDEYPSLTDNELPIIMQAGVSGELGKECWVSGASVLQWIRLYSRHQIRLNIVDDRHDERHQVRLTKEEVNARNEQSWNDGYERGKACCEKNGTIFHKDGFAMPQWPAMIYDEFCRRGIISDPTPEQSSYAQAQAKVHNQQHPLKFQLEEEGVQLHYDDIFKAYLLEAHYKQI